MQGSTVCTAQYTQNMAVKGTLRHSCNTPQYNVWYPQYSTMHCVSTAHTVHTAQLQYTTIPCVVSTVQHNTMHCVSTAHTVHMAQLQYTTIPCVVTTVQHNAQCSTHKTAHYSMIQHNALYHTVQHNISTIIYRAAYYSTVTLSSIQYSMSILCCTCTVHVEHLPRTLFHGAQKVFQLLPV